MNGCKAIPQGQAKSKVLCIQTRRILWLKNLAKHLAKLEKLLKKQKLAELENVDLQLASSSP